MKHPLVLQTLKPGLVAGLLLIAFAAAADTARAAAGNCDRECLRGFVTRYLDALIAHNPGALPVAGSVKFTEDSAQMKLGDGLWKSASGFRTYRQDVLDVRQGVAGSQVVIEEGGSPVLLELRLKVVDQKITEVETMTVRNQKEGVLFNVAGLQTAAKTMAVVPDRSQIPTRQEAIKIAEFYPAGLKVGSFVSVDAPFASNAYRMENGVTTAGPGCSRAGCENIKTQTIIKHPGITHRLAAVDEELGIVLLRMDFGETSSYGPGNALIAWEAFKIYGGQIHAVEAFMRYMPSSAGSGWD